ncbi:MAG: class I SAM-dependent methyltransferase [Planctomycetota bacterium]|nr:MAG: class I SAM-dependent methyltransferase [Planctomycetota bacterium]
MSATGTLRLTTRHAALLEQALRSAPVDELVALLWKLRRRRSVASASSAALSQARALELVDASTSAPPRLTPLGAKVSDSLNEYSYWMQRGKRHHWSEELRALRTERLRGKRILEIGCGAGVNLLSLQRITAVVGIDVEPLYLQFGAILARLEGVAAPARVCGFAERLPFEDESFDVALFHGSLAYMDIEFALREAARVLRPGGRVIAILADLRQALADRARQRRFALLKPGVLAREGRSFLGMLAYPWVGRLFLAPFAPVHVTRRRTRRWMTAAGLQPNPLESETVACETCFVADKAGAAGRARSPTAVVAHARAR